MTEQEIRIAKCFMNMFEKILGDHTVYEYFMEFDLRHIHEDDEYQWEDYVREVIIPQMRENPAMLFTIEAYMGLDEDVIKEAFRHGTVGQQMVLHIINVMRWGHVGSDFTYNFVSNEWESIDQMKLAFEWIFERKFGEGISKGMFLSGLDIPEAVVEEIDWGI